MPRQVNLIFLDWVYKVDAFISNLFYVFCLRIAIKFRVTPTFISALFLVLAVYALIIQDMMQIYISGGAVKAQLIASLFMILPAIGMAYLVAGTWRYQAYKKNIDKDLSAEFLFLVRLGSCFFLQAASFVLAFYRIFNAPAGSDMWPMILSNMCYPFIALMFCSFVYSITLDELEDLSHPKI
jgi:hypothetical protein